MNLSLVSPGTARKLDAEACSSWGLSPFALVEAAGRASARLLTEALPGLFPVPGSSEGKKPRQMPGHLPRLPPRILAFAGAGNNGADALVMLRALILSGHGSPASSWALVNPLPAADEDNPRSAAFRALVKMEVPCRPWTGTLPEDIPPDLIIDGIAGTGISGPLRGPAREMAEALGALTARREGIIGKRGPGIPVVSIDLPSGNFEGWEPGMPMVEADLTLGIEPLKTCLYSPPARIFGGRILPVTGIFPPALITAYKEAELSGWPAAAGKIKPVRADAYKDLRGIVEIHAGSVGSTGAARLAARGAQAAGAGIVRLMTDREIYPILAASAGGIMVAPRKNDAGETIETGRFKADALLLGPGWGKGPDRLETLKEALAREAEGTPLVLDADAIRLAKGEVFHGNAILTPHPGEFAAWTGIPAAEVLRKPGPALLETARERNAVILFKSCVLIIAGPEGELVYLDGLNPALAAGGTGDLLAGFCAALAARMKAGDEQFDGLSCAEAAAALLLKSACSGGKFIEPLELAETAAELAGTAWL